MESVVIAVYAESEGQVHNSCRLTESLRTFAGTWRDAPVWVYMPSGQAVEDRELGARLGALGAELRTSDTPEIAQWLFYGGKPFAAAAAEEAAAGRFEQLVWLDDDTVILSEPQELDLAADEDLTYCPVMHNRSGTLYGEPPNAFWSRIYDRMQLTEDLLFPMITPADQQKIRAYFHCGQLAVRPEKGILRGWARDFETLCGDSVLVEMCKADREKRIFLHQTALTSAVLRRAPRAAMRELSDQYNYPIFFEKVYGGERVYDSIEGVVTIRCLVLTEQMGVDWQGRLRGPADRVAWLAERLQ